MDEELEWWSFSWTVTVIGIALFISFLWLNRNQASTAPSRECSGDGNTSTCGLPTCARCQSLVSTQKLKLRCEEFFSTPPGMRTPLEARTRVLSLITDSLEHKSDIVSSIYGESGYRLVPNMADQLPHVWMLPDLDRHTFWSGDMHSSLQEVVCTMENPETFQAIWDEFSLLDGQEEGWKVNSVPSGRWRVYHLYDQGSALDDNINQCQFTAKLVSSLSPFMREHVFGNVMFSVLEAGSSIEPHIGPCNYRLRCHLPLMVPLGYRLRVGRDTASWEVGKLMIFDDSFVHEVWHEGPPGVGAEGEKENGRVVLIFDIWHPSVTLEEQVALKYIHTDYIVQRLYH